MTVGSGAGLAATRWALLAGAAVGVGLAAYGVMTGSPPAPQSPPAAAVADLPTDAVARVNDRLISQQEFSQVLQLDLAEGAPNDAATRRRVIVRMIDEELRTQRGIELGLHLTDPRVRMDLATAVAEAATVAVSAHAPTEGELRAFHDANTARFASRGPLKVQHVWVAIIDGNLGEAYSRARTVAQLLREGQSAETIAAVAGNPFAHAVPAGAVSPQALGNVIGRAALDAVLTLRPGQVTDPIRATAGFHVLRLVDRRPLAAPGFEAARSDVEAEFNADRMRRALADQARALRQAATVAVAPELK